MKNTNFKIGDKVKHTTTKETGTVTGYCFSHTKVKVDFNDGNPNYPAPIRNLIKL